MCNRKFLKRRIDMKHMNGVHTGADGLLHKINGIPGKILSIHDHNYVAHAVLHELCHPTCFDLPRAAYFVDNPDFDIMRGVAGIARDEVQCEIACAWNQPDTLSEQLQKSSFKDKEKQVVDQLAQELHIEHPDYIMWPMKHDNHGLLIFEHPKTRSWDREHLLNGLHLLSFCPIA
jgi:hypothetical protein